MNLDTLQNRIPGSTRETLILVGLKDRWKVRMMGSI